MGKVFWSTMWDRYSNNESVGNLSIFQQHFALRMKLCIQTLQAIDKRISNRKSKRTYIQKTTPFSKIPHHKLYLEVARYYENYYTLGIKNKKPRVPEKRSPAYLHIRTLETKNRNYRHSKYDEIIKKEWNTYRFNKGLSVKPIDDEFIMKLYAKIPTSAFNEEEIKLWKMIYDFATKKKVSFQYVKRSDRRTIKTTYRTYVSFSAWYEANKQTYSCKKRFFVPLFIKYCKRQKILVSPTKVDELLRYDIDKDCFNDNDKTIILHQGNRKDFFTVLEKILKTTQKK